ncbi:MAG: hypothetical protein PVI23_06170 [Maricaulaceae bacterium]
MNHKHRKVLHQLFAHPEPTNLAPSDINAVLGELGAEIEERHGARFAVKLNDRTVVFHHAQHSLPKDEVRAIRRFLEEAGVDPERDYPLG